MASLICSLGHEEDGYARGWIRTGGVKDYEMLWERDGKEFGVVGRKCFRRVEHFRDVSYFRLVEGQEEDRFDA